MPIRGASGNAPPNGKILCPAAGPRMGRSRSEGARGQCARRRTTAHSVIPEPRTWTTKAFASLRGLVATAREHLAVTRGVAERRARPVGGPAPVTQAGARTSSCPRRPAFDENNKEEGGRRSRTVKTERSTIFTVSGSTLHAVTAGEPEAGGLGSPWGAGVTAAGDVHGSRPDRDLERRADHGAAGRAGAAPAARAGGAALASYPAGGTVVTRSTCMTRRRLEVTERMTIDGAFGRARQNGATGGSP